MKIRKTSVKNLRNMEFYQFMDDFFKLLKPYNLEAIKINEEVEKLKSLFDKFDNCLKKENAFASPEGMQKADEDRDFFMRKLYAIISAFVGYPETKKGDAAISLMNTLELYDGSEIASMAHNQESASITNLMQDLNNEKNKKYISILGITELKEGLEKANNDFIALKQHKTTSQALVIRGATKAARVETENVYAYLCEKINALYVLDTNRTYHEIIIKINELIKKYLSVLDLRKKTK